MNIFSKGFSVVVKCVYTWSETRVDVPSETADLFIAQYFITSPVRTRVFYIDSLAIAAKLKSLPLI